MVVATAGRLALRTGVEPPTRWFGLLTPVRLDRTSVLPAFMLIGVALAVIAWLHLCLLASRRSISTRRTGAVIAVWCLPVVLGPPILSLDVYSYVAHGAMLNADLNPYRHGPIVLGHQPSLLASDPVWRSSRAPYGPVALGVVKVAYALSGDSVLGTVVILRVVALVGISTIMLCVALAADPLRRARAVALTASPIVILQLLGAVHLEAMMVALLAAGLLAARSRRPVAAMMLLTAAAAVKWPAAFAIAVVAVWHAGMATRSGRPARLLVVARDAGVVTACALVGSVLVPDGFGWLRSAATPTAGLTLYAPTVGLADVLTRFSDLTRASVGFAEALNVTRTLGIVITSAVMLWLLATVRDRSPAATVGWGLLTLAVLAPVLYPWYLAWGLVPLAVATDRIRTSVIVTVSAIGSFLALPHCELLFAGLPGAAPWLERQAPFIAMSTLAGVLICAFILVRSRNEWSTAAPLER